MADDERPARTGRSRAAPTAADPETRTAAKKSPRNQLPDLPETFVGKYLRVGSNIYRTSADQRPVIRLAPDRIRTGDLDALPDIVRIAKANGWTGIRISGGDKFKRAAYLAAASQGLTVENYTPSQRVAAEAERMRARLARRKSRGTEPSLAEPGVGAPARREDARQLSERFLRQNDDTNARDPDLWRAQTLVAQARAIATARHPGDPTEVARETETRRQQIAGRIARGDPIAPALHRDGRPMTAPRPLPERDRERAGRSR